MKLNIKKLLKKVVMITFMIYFSVTVYKQQRQLNTYKENISTVEKQIKEQTEYKESLISEKENSTSLEYIEEIARTKLNMYMPDEKVYIDIGN